MKFLMIGYGKMGRMIASIAAERGHQVSATVDPFAPDAAFREICPAAAAGADLAFEFGIPATAPANIKALVGLGLPVVVGTTGWFGRLEEARAAVESSSGRVVYGANYSIGVNLFYRIAAEAARLMDAFPQYDVGGYEIHHNQKGDSPSGTAKALAKIVMGNMERKTALCADTLAERKPEPGELHFASLRMGSVPGTHALVFDSAADTIELRHTARSREGFARGAVLAAEWLIASGRRGLIPVEEMYQQY
jgi:4-hydroxy-tetrahydrodipicolinate reductase